MCCGQVVFFVSAWIIGIVIEQRRRYIRRIPLYMYNNFYNTCTVVHIIVIALQTAFPLPNARGSRKTAGLYTRLLFRNFAVSDVSTTSTATTTTRQIFEPPTMGRYTCIIHNNILLFSTLKRISRTLSRKPRRGEYDLNVICA